jgi:hypothetical protein
MMIAAGLMAAACDKTPTAPTPQGPAPVTTLFSGTLEARASKTNSFSLAQSGTAAITLVSLTTGTGEVADPPVTLTVGSLNGTVCAATTSVTASPALKSQISVSLSAGNYCTTITDLGADETRNFLVRVVAYPVTSSTDVPTTETIATNLPVGGYVIRTFTAAKAGTIALTLSTVGTSTSLGLGLGVPDAGGAACALTSFVMAESGSSPQLSLPADAGTYCMKLVDTGNLAAITRGTVSFTATIAHP